MHAALSALITPGPINATARCAACRRSGGVASAGALFAVVLANIVADVIIPLSAQVPALLAEDGVFLCSGIIDDRAAEVLEKLKADGWDVFEQRSSEGWFSYLCK